MVRCIQAGWSGVTALVELIPFGVFYGRQNIFFMDVGDVGVGSELYVYVYGWAWEWRRIALHRAGVVYFSRSI